MTKRTIYLDHDRRDRRTRKIHVRAYRWYATAELNRDGYADYLISRGDSADLPTAYTEAVAKAENTSIDRIWYDGYPDGFMSINGPRCIILPVPYAQIETAVEALRSAELHHDYSGLHTLADQLALPVEDWLAPGERELIRGADFSVPPGVFLNFLRGKAKKSGLRLNGRATRGSVWVCPTLPLAEKLRRERFPERYPGWVDRWTGYVEPEDTPLRPWVGGREQNLSLGAHPVQFQHVQTPSGGKCPCGMNLRASWDDGKKHATHHAMWAIGVRPPKNLDWSGDLAVVTAESPIAWRKLTYQMGRMPQRENGYDFNSWSHLGEPEKTSDNVRAYLLRANGYVIGYVAAHDVSHHRRWDLLDGSNYGDRDDTLRPSIDLIWVAGSYRGKGIGATLVQALVDHSGCQGTDASWSTPISDAGRRLVRRVSPEGIWVS
ncbi:GNAT family N-acetyltransferase [Nonomuraea sp. NPDC046802]|uniref:GNAT family N-acetyltransferase n=1 Tax=Nonomuraea sp. NPDC046802 TaxID=3154919 RepID=UPI0033D7CA84